MVPPFTLFDESPSDSGALLASVGKVPLSQLSSARSGLQGDNDNCEGGTGVVDAVVHS